MIGRDRPYRRSSYQRRGAADWLLDNWVSIVAVAIIICIVLGVGAAIWFRITAPHEGTIHAKQYNPAYSSTSCYTSGKQTICTPEYHPASWEFDLYKTETDHGWRYVDETTYHQYHVGEYYPGD